VRILNSRSYSRPNKNCAICKINVRRKTALKLPMNTLKTDSRGCSCNTFVCVKLKMNKKNEKRMKEQKQTRKKAKTKLTIGLK
jgi:hypothetical protein